MHQQELKRLITLVDLQNMFRVIESSRVLTESSQGREVWVAVAVVQRALGGTVGGGCTQPSRAAAAAGVDGVQAVVGAVQLRFTGRWNLGL